ncbi:hypothetical protein [Psychrobacillus sp. NPDC093200]|uniref:hypothetical protein n=1 Tax=Psychrobacillus sp. NPDC093200 TaxID=3390656 RepID=UPI003D06B2EA
MKKITKILYFNISLCMLVGCSNNTNEEYINDSSEKNSALESTKETVKINSDSTKSSSDSNEASKEDKEILSHYSSEQIEYARVWLKLGANQEIDGLYVQRIPAGTLINPNDDTSASYPEDVIQLAGSRLVDGSVTYSGNGDGTINVYNVPLRWDGSYPAGEKFYTDIIENTKLVYVDPGNDEKILALIKLLK